jgi:uncharacterized protein
MAALFFTIASPYVWGAKVARVIGFFRAHKRLIAFSLVLAYAAFFLIMALTYWDPDALYDGAVYLFLLASQLFWIRRVRDLGKRLIASQRWRKALGTAGLIVNLFLCAFFTMFSSENENMRAHLTMQTALVGMPFSVWIWGSVLGLLIVMVLWIADRVERAASWTFKKLVAPRRLDPPSPARRRFLEQTAIALSATSFGAVAYGLFYERLDVEVTHPRIRLARLPKAFEGFRIAQLSDIHISPFAPADYIRRCMAITNGLNPNLIVMTGDYLAWDPAAQGEVVQALSGLRAPYGVFGCLGNHEESLEVEESMTRLFAAQGIHILRQERAPIRLRGETLNLIGVDNSHWELQGIERLVLPETVNILLTHLPEAFDPAAELSIDLTLAGHTHGGQFSLEFIHRGWCLSRLETPYVSGWYEKAGGQQLYVNRGIGVCGFPMRFGARPEITVYELVRGV